MLTRRRLNRILAIEDNGCWLRSINAIGNYFIREFEELFATSSLVIPCLGVLGGSKILDAENVQIMSILEVEKIKNAIWELHPLKSPGRDGFLGSFYRTYWNIVQGQVVDFV